MKAKVLTNRIPTANQPTAPAAVPTAARGKMDAELVRRANRWRDSYNPLRSLVLSRVVSLLEAGERGEYAELQWLYRMVEKRYPVLRALIVRRRAALQKLDWEIKIVSTVEEDSAEYAQAKLQRDFLRSRYELITNLRQAIDFLALAEFRGFSFLARHTYDDGPNAGAVQELHWLPQWNIVRDGPFGDWYWNPNANAVTATTLGESSKIDPGSVIWRECAMPINEIAVLAFVRSNLCEKDWIAFCELFGIPRAIVIMPPGEAPQGQGDAYKAAAEAVSEGASGALPNGADAKFPTASVRGNEPFSAYIDAKKEDVVLAGTGGKLTMLNDATGLGGSQGDVHDDAFDDLARGEAGEISEIFQRQFDAVELDAKFPGQPHYVYFELCAAEQEERAQVITNAKTLKEAGYAMKCEQLKELTGYEIEEVETPQALPGGAPPNRQPAPGAEGNPPDVEGMGEEALSNRCLQGLRNGIAAVLRNRSSDGLKRDLATLATTFHQTKA